MGIVKNAWRLGFDGSPSYIWESKIRKVRNELKEWVKTEYQNTSSRKSQLQYRLSAMQSKMEKEEITSMIIS